MCPYCKGDHAPPRPWVDPFLRPTEAAVATEHDSELRYRICERPDNRPVVYRVTKDGRHLHVAPFDSREEAAAWIAGEKGIEEGPGPERPHLRRKFKSAV